MTWRAICNMTVMRWMKWRAISAKPNRGLAQDGLDVVKHRGQAVCRGSAPNTNCSPFHPTLFNPPFLSNGILCHSKQHLPDLVIQRNLLTQLGLVKWHPVTWRAISAGPNRGRGDGEDVADVAQRAVVVAHALQLRQLPQQPRPRPVQRQPPPVEPQRSEPGAQG
jgi:hypothetical protein